jgi:hypothetical protein
MAKTLEEVRADVLGLPVGERMDLAQDLIRSVEGLPEVEGAWLEEIKRRTALDDAAHDIDADVLDAEMRARGAH